MREKIKKFRVRHKEVNEQLKQENENITRLKVQEEEKKNIEESLIAMVERKYNECIRLEQEMINLRSYLEKARSYEDRFKTRSTMLDELIVGKKASKDKGGLGLQKVESSKENQNAKKIEDTKNNGMLQNQGNNDRRPAPYQTTKCSMAPMCFNGICYFCNKIGHRQMECRR